MKRFIDHANWTDIAMVSTDVGAKVRRHGRFSHDGHVYKNDGERRLAELLDTLGIPFVPDVAMTFTDDSLRSFTFVPDFVFCGRPFIWSGRRKPQLIHGIEAKGKQRGGKFSRRSLDHVEGLYKARGIRILLLSNSSIKHYHRMGSLPLKPLPPPD
ncbi:MAG: hypothetical protein RLZZ324_938 [Candidatus Parcubacteria bacterium]|jgi:hypothetical protein